METEKENHLEYQYKSFVELLNPFGSRDLYTALNTVSEVKEGYNNYSEADILFNILDEFKESMGIIDNSQIDIVAIVYEDILQKARNKIDDVCKYDFINDSKSEIYVAGNYMCTSFDCDEKAKEELKNKVKKWRKELNEDVFCLFLFNELDI